MTQDITYDGSPLTIVRLDDALGAPEWVEAADHGRIGDGTITIDDVAGTQRIVGHKTVTVEEDECAVPRTLTAVIGPKKIRRGSGKTGASRIITATLLDLNARLSFRFIHGTGSRRPIEEVGERVDWLLGTSALSGLVSDFGFVAHPTTELDEADYRGRFPEDVLTDMATEVGFNFFAYWDADEADVGLWFADSNTSTDFSSTLRFSNVLSDVDDSTTFRLGADSELDQDPSQVISQGWMPYARGNVIRTRAATETIFPRRGGVAPSSDVKRRANARRRLDRYLFARRNEEDTFTEEVELPADKINLVRAGQRVQVRHSYAAPEGYGAFSWFRITETRKKPLVAPDEGLYKLTMTLSPQEGGCSVTPTFVQYQYQDCAAQLTAPNWTWRATPASPAGTGTLLGLMVITDGLNSGEMVSAPTGWSTAFMNTNVKADDTGDWCSVFYKKAEGESYVDLLTTGSLTGPRVMFFEYAGLTNPVLNSQTSVNRQNAGFADIPTIPYPAGAALVLGLNFMHEGPQSGDALSVSGTGNNLRTPQNSALSVCGAGGTDDGSCFLGHPCLSISDAFRTPAGSSGSFTGWQVQFTGSGPTMTIGLVFVGDNC